MCGDVEVMRMLLKHGADPTIMTTDHTTPLMAVAGVGYTDGFIHDRSDAESMDAWNTGCSGFRRRVSRSVRKWPAMRPMVAESNKSVL